MDDLNNPIDYNKINNDELDLSVKLMNMGVSKIETVVENALKKLESKKDDPRINKIINEMKREIKSIGIVVENLVSHQQVIKSNLEKYPTRPQPRDMKKMEPESKKRYDQTWQDHHRRRADYPINIANQSKSYQERVINTNEDIFKGKKSIERLSKLGDAELIKIRIKEEEKEDELRKSEQAERERLNALRDQEELERIRELEKEEIEYFKNNGMTFSIQDKNPNFKAPFDSPFKEKENKPEVISDESKSLELIKDSTKKIQEDIKEIKEVVKKGKKDKDKEGAEEGGGNKTIKDNSEEVKEETRGKKMASLLKTGLSKTLTTSLKVATAPALMVLGGMHGMLKGIYNSRLMGVAKVVAIMGGILYAIDWVRVLLNRWQIDMTEDYEAFIEQYGKLAPIIESLVKLYNDLGAYFKGEKSLFDGQEVTLTKLFLDVGDVLLTALGQGLEFILERVGLFLHNLNPLNKKELTLEQYRYYQAEKSELGYKDVDPYNIEQVARSEQSTDIKKVARGFGLSKNKNMIGYDDKIDPYRVYKDIHSLFPSAISHSIRTDMIVDLQKNYGMNWWEASAFVNRRDIESEEYQANFIQSIIEAYEKNLPQLTDNEKDMLLGVDKRSTPVSKLVEDYDERDVMGLVNKITGGIEAYKNNAKLALKERSELGEVTLNNFQKRLIDTNDLSVVGQSKLDNAKVVTGESGLSQSLLLITQRKNEIMEGLVKPQEQKQEPNTSIVNISASQNNRTVNANTPDAYLSLYGNKTLVK